MATKSKCTRSRILGYRRKFNSSRPAAANESAIGPQLLDAVEEVPHASTQLSLARFLDRISARRDFVHTYELGCRVEGSSDPPNGDANRGVSSETLHRGFQSLDLGREDAELVRIEVRHSSSGHSPW